MYELVLEKAASLKGERKAVFGIFLSHPGGKEREFRPQGKKEEIVAKKKKNPSLDQRGRRLLISLPI